MQINSRIRRQFGSIEAFAQDWARGINLFYEELIKRLFRRTIKRHFRLRSKASGIPHAYIRDFDMPNANLAEQTEWSKAGKHHTLNDQKDH